MPTASFAAGTDGRGSRGWARMRLALWLSQVAERETFVPSLSSYNNAFIRKVIYSENGKGLRSIRKGMNTADDPTSKKYSPLIFWFICFDCFLLCEIAAISSLRPTNVLILYGQH